MAELAWNSPRLPYGIRNTFISQLETERILLNAKDLFLSCLYVQQAFDPFSSKENRQTPAIKVLSNLRERGIFSRDLILPVQRIFDQVNYPIQLEHFPDLIKG